MVILLHRRNAFRVTSKFLFYWATSTADVAGTVDRPSTLAIDTTSTGTAVGTKYQPQTLTVTAASFGSTAGTIDNPQTLTITATSTGSCVGNIGHVETLTIDATSAGTASGTIDQPQTLAIDTTSAGTAVGTIDRPSTLTIASTSFGSTVGQEDSPQTLTITATSMSTASGTIDQPQTLAIDALSMSTAAGTINRPSTLTLASTSTGTTAAGQIDSPQTLVIDATSYADCVGSDIQLTFAATSTGTTTGTIDRPSTLTVASTSMSSCAGTEDNPQTLTITSTSTASCTGTVDHPVTFDSIIILGYYPEFGTGGTGVTNKYKGMEFTTGSSPSPTKLDDIRFGVYKSESPTGYVEGSLWTKSAGTPGTKLATSTNSYDVSTFPLTSPDAFNAVFTFGSVNLDANTTYYAMIGYVDGATYDATNKITLEYTYTGSYGVGYVYGDIGSWSQAGASSEVYFKVNTTYRAFAATSYSGCAGTIDRPSTLTIASTSIGSTVGQEDNPQTLTIPATTMATCEGGLLIIETLAIATTSTASAAGTISLEKTLTAAATSMGTCAGTIDNPQTLTVAGTSTGTCVGSVETLLPEISLVIGQADNNYYDLVSSAHIGQTFLNLSGGDLVDIKFKIYNGSGGDTATFAVEFYECPYGWYSSNPTIGSQVGATNTKQITYTTTPTEYTIELPNAVTLAQNTPYYVKIYMTVDYATYPPWFRVDTSNTYWGSSRHSGDWYNVDMWMILTKDGDEPYLGLAATTSTSCAGQVYTYTRTVVLHPSGAGSGYGFTNLNEMRGMSFRLTGDYLSVTHVSFKCWATSASYTKGVTATIWAIDDYETTTSYPASPVATGTEVTVTGYSSATLFDFPITAELTAGDYVIALKVTDAGSSQACYIQVSSTSTLPERLWSETGRDDSHDWDYWMEITGKSTKGYLTFASKSVASCIGNESGLVNKVMLHMDLTDSDANWSETSGIPASTTIGSTGATYDGTQGCAYCQNGFVYVTSIIDPRTSTNWVVNTTSGYTWAFWIYTTNARTEPLCYNYIPGTQSVTVSTLGNGVDVIWGSDDGSWYSIDTGYTVPEDQWVLYVVRRLGSNIQLYQNNVLISNQTWKSGSNLTFSYLYIARDQTAESHDECYLKYATVWERAIDGAASTVGNSGTDELASLYNSQSPQNWATLQAIV